MKLIIAGSRGFDKPSWLLPAISQFVDECGSVTELVCGMCKGADMLGYDWAEENNIPVKEFPADWEKHGKGAGAIRNKEMAKYADGLIAFWDGQSRGTKNMIQAAQENHKPVFIFRF